jgi:endoglucanase
MSKEPRAGRGALLLCGLPCFNHGMTRVVLLPLAVSVVTAALGCAPSEKAPIAPDAPPAVAPVAAPGVETAPAAPVSAAPKACTGKPSAAADGLVDDFEDGNNRSAEVAGRGGWWYTAADNAGSTISPQGNFAPSDGGAAGTKKAAHVTGKTASEQAAWGAVFGVGLLQDNRLYDASKYAGVSFWAKAADKSGKTFRFKVSDVSTHPAGKVCKEDAGGCWNHFGTELTLTSEWKEYTIAFADLRQEEGWGNPHPASLSVNQLLSLDWTMPRGTEFDLWVDEIKLVECQ